MARHIDELGRELRGAVSRDERQQLVRRLMFTGDRRAAGPLLESADVEDIAFWVGEAFSYYFPNSPDLLDEVVQAVQRQGLLPSRLRILEQLGAPSATVKNLAGEALFDGDARIQDEAVLAAQRYPDDRFMDRLIEIAISGTGAPCSRSRAVFALAANRTDEGCAR